MNVYVSSYDRDVALMRVSSTNVGAKLGEVSLYFKGAFIAQLEA